MEVYLRLALERLLAQLAVSSVSSGGSSPAEATSLSRSVSLGCFQPRPLPGDR